MKNQLAIEISENAVRFATIQDGVVQSIDNYSFKDKIDYHYKEQLDQIFLEKGYKEREYDDYSLSWYSMYSTLLPNNVFSETKPEELFRLCYNTDIPSEHIDYNRIPEQGIVNLFEIPLWVKSFFVIKYPRSIIQHEGSHVIRGLFSEPSFKLKTTLVIYNDFFLMCIAKENKLQFYTVFDYHFIDDIVYHLMFTLQQKEYLKENGAIQICPGVGSSAEQISELQQKLQSLQDLKNATITVNTDFITNSQKLCV